MTPASLTAWRNRLSLSKTGAAEALGCSREALRLWEQGKNPIPLYIALACAAVALGIKPQT
jgi:DNA-binding XRE family transcriptional regulator